MPLTKRDRGRLRQLAGLAYQRELDGELRSLSGAFDAWREGTIDCFDLSAKIHTFHNGASRDLYVLYERSKPEMTVGRAVAMDLISEADVPPTVLSEIQGVIEFFQNQLAADEDDR